MFLKIDSHKLNYWVKGYKHFYGSVYYIVKLFSKKEVPIYKVSSTKCENTTFTTSMPALSFIKIIFMLSLLIKKAFRKITVLFLISYYQASQIFSMCLFISFNFFFVSCVYDLGTLMFLL